MTKYAKEKVLKVCNLEDKKSIIIAHGVNSKFNLNPNERTFRNVEDFNILNPCKILYISSIEVYKQQLNVIEAVEKLHNEGLHVKLTLIGPPGSGTRKFQKKIKNQGYLFTISLLTSIKHLIILNLNHYEKTYFNFSVWII